MGRRYTINNAGSRPDSADLVGCQIVKRDGEEVYDFLSKSGGGVLASSLNTPPLMFTFSNYMGWDWVVRVTSSSATQMSGTWSNDDPNNVSPEQESDSWTATGTGVGEPGEDEARAASATSTDSSF